MESKARAKEKAHIVDISPPVKTTELTKAISRRSQFGLKNTLM